MTRKIGGLLSRVAAQASRSAKSRRPTAIVGSLTLSR
jgi:hypothetical protein